MNRLALVGYGKMGRRVAEMAPLYGFEVVRIFDPGQTPGTSLTPEQLASAEVAIEFTHPDAAPDNLRHLAEAGVRTVCGTTGWYEALPEIAPRFETSGLVYGPNFSIGVAIFAEIVAEAAARIQRFEEYGAFAYELHHRLKQDAPSGTLNHLIEAMRKAGYEREVSIASLRAGSIPGTHTLGFDSPVDTITLTHEARNRDGFARGALFAAQWLLAHQGVHEFAALLRRED